MKRTDRKITKRIARTLILLSFSLIFFTACNKGERGTVNTSDGQPKPFTSSAEAVQQGKKDLTELLKARTDLNLGTDAAQVEKSQPEQGLEAFEVDFQKLLQAADNITGLEQVAGAAKGNTTPLSVENQVIAIIDTRKDTEGWRVSAISNQAIKKDLNEIRKARADLKGKMNYFEVPNINARIYSVSVDGQNQYVTNYDGFTFEKPVSISELVSKLRADAQVFERKYGEELKKQKLVK